MFDDTRSAILPRTDEARWGSLVLAFGLHGAVGVTLLLATLLVVHPVKIVEPPRILEITIPIEMQTSGGSPPLPAARTREPRPHAAAPVVVPEPIVQPEPPSDLPEPAPQPREGSEPGFDLGTGPGVPGPAFGTGPGTGTGSGVGPGDGPGEGSFGGEPLELSGEIEPPSLVVRVEPLYPHVARVAGIEGRVVLRAVIGPDGTVERIEPVSATNPILAGAAEQAVLRWRYEPALWRGTPVRVWVTVRVDFTLR